MRMQQSSRQGRMVLELGPVPTAAAAGRGFVREVCGRWELAGLGEPAALVANELVANAVTHAGTALELRVELRGRRLEVAVHDQDRNLSRVQAARDGTGRGFGLLIVDRVAADWGVRPGPAGGKTVWCALELPPPQADPGLVWTKLVPPPPQAELIHRPGLQARLRDGLEGKLCLLDAPAGFGKTTLLAQWATTAGAGRVAWVSLDDGDNDPTRLWVHVVEALRTVQSNLGATALEALGGRSADLHRLVLPSLLNELARLARRWCWCWTATTWSPTPPATRSSASSWTTSQRMSMWRCRPVAIRRCPWPGCGPEGS
jgi:hypothetical protein